MLDNNNWRPTPPGGVGGGGGGTEAGLDGGDWRSQLLPESRERIVNKIVETLERHLPVSGPEGLQELKKIAVRFEEKIYIAATCQSDYLRKISLKMSTFETNSQSTIIPNALPSNSAGNNTMDAVSIDISAQTAHSAGGDWQEEAYQKMKSMREQYLPELNEIYHKISMKLQQHESLPQQPKSEKLEKLKAFKGMLERVIAVLQVNKADIVPIFKEKLVHYEKQIINFIHASRPRVPIQQGQLPPHLHTLQQQQSQPQITQVQSHENQMNPQLQSMNLQGSVASMQQNNMGNLHH